MSQTNQQSCSSKTDELEEWKVLAAPEGFARVTRNGRSDIYLVQNHEGFCWDGRISVAFYLDDFDPDSNKEYGRPLYLNKSDQIENLGPPDVYFAPANPDWDLKCSLVRLFPRSAGLLPIVRACETLKRSGIALTNESICETATRAYLEYVGRRAALNQATSLWRTI
jgi:hypothetical protein